MDWINKHPNKNELESPLWIGFQGRRKFLSHSAARMILKKLKKKSGVNKRVNPHNFRHSRATHLANHLTEAQMKEYFGWTQSSSMASIYVHLSGRDVDKALLKVYGIQQDEEEKESSFVPKNCIRCGYSNPPTNKLCGKCGLVLDEKKAMELVKKEAMKKRAGEVIGKLMEDPEFIKLLERRIANY